ncbi:MAG: DUF58 domain-containing protein [Planctomycetes bacterium]|nr:DUF58 domain-containing protein [Planctomycetota bacterium]
MLSSRGLWFLVVVSLVLMIGAFAIPYYSVVPAIIAVTLLLWFMLEWTLFHVRSNAAVSRLKITRHVLQGGREVPMVWAGLPFEVRVTIENPSAVSIPFAVMEDRGAVATERVEGSTKRFVSIPAGAVVGIVYTLKAPSPGILRFEGVKVRVADLNGFFYRRVFLRDAVEFLVLPPLTDDDGKQRATKRDNTLPPPGIHRLRRPGSGSELLDLRDYRPGDPPKMIAWKASARRDRLITKEFENDVPVRAVLFLDTSEGVRLGPPGNTLLTRMAGVAAAVAQASAGNRDLVGLTTFDEKESKASSPARTKIHMIGILRRLAEASALQPGVAGVPMDQLTRRAYPLAQDLYPELMTKRVNSMPLSRLWIPLLDRKYGWIALVLLLMGLGLFSLGSMAMSTAIFDPEVLADRNSLKTDVLLAARKWFLRSINYAASLVPAKWPLLAKFAWMNLMFVVTFFPPATVAVIFWFFHGIRGWFGDRKTELTRRKQLATLFSLQDGTGPDGIERYVFDDDAFAKRVAQFLQHHLLRCPVPLYDDQGRYRFRCIEKAPVLADAMLRAVGRARDNELYVLLADLSELGADLGPVIKACRVARARHHHILVIVPWPADVPSPDDPDGATTASAAADEDAPGRKSWGATKSKPGAKGKMGRPGDMKGNSLVKFVRQSLTKQYHESFKTLRRELGRVGATVMRVNDGDPVRLVLDRLDRLRGMRSRR